MPAGAQVISNEKQSCALYGPWTVLENRRPQDLACDVGRTNEILKPRPHRAWCMRQTDERRRRAALIQTTSVAHRYAQQGIDVRRQ